MALLVLLGLVCLTELTEEVCGRVSSDFWEIRLDERVLNRFLSLLDLLRSVQLSSKESFNLKNRLILVNSKLSEKIAVIFLDKAFKDLKLHHVVVILWVPGHNFTDLGFVHICKLIIEISYFLS